MTTTFKATTLTLVSAAALLGQGTVCAQDSSLDMDVAGYIEPRCEFTQFSASELDFSVQDSGTLSFELYCNLAMSVTLESRNGAMLHEQLSGRLGRSAEYERVYDTVLSLAEGGFSWETNSIEMQDGAVFSTGDAVVFDTSGKLDITLRESIAGLKSHAGDYNDTISITLSPSLAAIN